MTIVSFAQALPSMPCSRSTRWSLPFGLALVPRMLVLRADRLVEAHRRQLAALAGRADELLEDSLVLQVRTPRRARAVIGEVVEGLVMELEQRIRIAGSRIVPAA